MSPLISTKELNQDGVAEEGHAHHQRSPPPAVLEVGDGHTHTQLSFRVVDWSPPPSRVQRILKEADHPPGRLAPRSQQRPRARFHLEEHASGPPRGLLGHGEDHMAC